MLTMLSELLMEGEKDKNISSLNSEMLTATG